MKKISKGLLLIIVAFVMFLAPTNIVKGANSDEIIILHTNDMHGQMDPEVKELAYLKAYKEKVGATALFDAGDASQGLPLNNITKGKVMGAIMKEIGYDVMTLGNHEFDYGRDEVLGKTDGFFTTFDKNKVVATNVYFTADSDVGTPGDPVFEKSIQFPRGGLNFSVFGAATPETYVKADPRHSKGIEFREPIQEILTEIVDSKYDNTDVYVILAHLGSDAETNKNWRGTTLAEKLSEIDALKGKQIVVIDGHSHTEYPEGLKFGDNVLYGQTGGSLATIGQMHINVNDPTKSYAKTVPMRDGYVLHEGMSNLTPDEYIVKMLNDAQKDFDDQTKKVVYDDNPVYLEGRREYTRTKETNLGNLISDATYAYALDTFDKFSHVSVINGGGIRESIEKGKITLKEIITTMPYGNRIVQIDVTGEEMLQMYEHALKVEADEVFDDGGLPLLKSDPALLHSSDSIRVMFDPRLPSGERVLEILIIDEDSKKLVPLELDKTYKVVTLEFLAVGGDGFYMLGGARAEGGTDSDIFADYLEAANKKEFDIDWSLYSEDLAPYRVVPTRAAEVEDSVKSLKDLIGDAKAYLKDESVYSEKSFKHLVLMIDNAENTAAKPRTLADLELAYTQLLSAMEDLEIDSEILKSFNEFTELVKSMDKYLNDKNSYTNASFKKFLEVYEEAKELAANLDPFETDVKEVDAMAERLLKAVDGLEKVKVPGDKTPVDTGIGYQGLIPSLLVALLAGGGYLVLRKRKE